MNEIIDSKQEVEITFPSGLLPVYKRRNVLFTKGDGAYLYDQNNKEYLDFASGIGVNILGHSNKVIINELNKQMYRPWHVSNGYRNKEAELLAQSLITSFGFDNVFFCNSGTESIECIIKTIRAWWYSIKGEQNSIPEILVFKGSFHGRGWGSMSASDNNPDKYKAFHPLMRGFKFLDITKESIIDNISDKTAAILLEPIQGHSGCVAFPDDLLRFIRKLCDDLNILLCYDCIQTGCGRTGKFFTYEYSGAKPDMLAIAKGIGGGLPMGVCLFNKKSSVLTEGQHGSTCGGHPICCALGNVILKEVTDLLPYINNISNYLNKSLNELVKNHKNLIKEIRGKGLLLGIVLSEKLIALNASCSLLNSGLLTIPSGNNTLRILPSYIITTKEVDRMIDVLENFLNEQ